MSASARKETAKDILLLTIAFGILYFSTIWVRPLSNPDEGRYAEIPREMAATGDWISPRLNGVLYYEKPPLFYWIEAATIKAAGETHGVSEWVVRIWPAAFALFGCLITYWAGRRLFGRKTALYSAGILGTSIIYYALGQIITLDMAVSVLLAASLLVFMVAVRAPPGRNRFWLCQAFFLLLALATLTKGLIGLVLPGAIIILWALVLKRWKDLLPFYGLVGIPLFLIVAVPWHVMAYEAHHPFAWYYFVHEHFLRFITPVGHDRDQPFWFFFVLLPVGLFPWVVFLPQSVRSIFSGGWKRIREKPDAVFLAIWILFILLFFSISSSKLIPYILPVYPALALLVGAAIAGEGPVDRPIKRRGALISFAVVGLLFAIAIPIAILQRGPKNAPDILPWTIAVAVILGGGAIGALVASRRSDGSRALLVPLLTCVAFYLLFNPLAMRLKNDSTKQLALYLKAHHATTDQVYSLLDYEQDLAPYFGQLVSVAANLPPEQQYGLKIENHNPRYPDAAEFIRRWQGSQRLYAVASQKNAAKFEAAHPHWKNYLILKDEPYVLLSNRPQAQP